MTETWSEREAVRPREPFPAPLAKQEAGRGARRARNQGGVRGEPSAAPTAALGDIGVGRPAGVSADARISALSERMTAKSCGKPEHQSEWARRFRIVAEMPAPRLPHRRRPNAPVRFRNPDGRLGLGTGAPLSAPGRRRLRPVPALHSTPEESAAAPISSRASQGRGEGGLGRAAQVARNTRAAVLARSPKGDAATQGPPAPTLKRATPGIRQTLAASPWIATSLRSSRGRREASSPPPRRRRPPVIPKAPQGLGVTVAREFGRNALKALIPRPDFPGPGDRRRRAAVETPVTAESTTLPCNAERRDRRPGRCDRPIGAKEASRRRFRCAA
ncbi:hypothetical protein DFR50_103176 [Roseiarcus fermentans]|uniref:Uncharacterized protein n=1 Tax=Roseiarcus fermentans TaxID=1473586 RepID=A0A366FUB5_9HYPH|nr:hypothetical protein DFR50_103176 [Roseiarcus fermentans]